MLRFRFLFLLISLFSLMFFVSVAKSQVVVDTVKNENEIKPKFFANLQHDHTTEFRGTQIIAPATLITLGVLGLTIPEWQGVEDRIKGEVSIWRDGRYLHFDDYVQYVPVASNMLISLCGAKAEHDYLDRLLTTATSYATMGIIVNVLKACKLSLRPDGSARNSWPSGHTATAFMGAELVRLEYGQRYPAIAVGAYVIATGVGFMRIYNQRHWVRDVCVGAGIGILSAQIAHWLLPYERRLFRVDKLQEKLRKKKSAKSSVEQLSLSPYYIYDEGHNAGVSFSMKF